MEKWRDLAIGLQKIVYFANRPWKYGKFSRFNKKKKNIENILQMWHEKIANFFDWAQRLAILLDVIANFDDWEPRNREFCQSGKVKLRILMIGNTKNYEFRREGTEKLQICSMMRVKIEIFFQCGTRIIANFVDREGQNTNFVDRCEKIANFYRWNLSFEICEFLM